jgi:hypothetical protein
MSRNKYSPSDVPEPRPICPYCKSRNIIYNGESDIEGPGELYRFECNTCNITSSYLYYGDQYLYFKTKSEEMARDNYVTYDEWITWASGYYSENVRSLMKDNKRYINRFNVIHNKGMEQPETTKNSLEEKEGDN